MGGLPRSGLPGEMLQPRPSMAERQGQAETLEVALLTVSLSIRIFCGLKVPQIKPPGFFGGFLYKLT